MMKNKKLFYGILVIILVLLVIGLDWSLNRPQPTIECSTNEETASSNQGQQPDRQLPGEPNILPTSDQKELPSTGGNQKTSSRFDNPFGVRQADPKNLKAVYDIGARYIGFGVHWGQIELSENNYNWNQLDKNIANFESAGLVPYPIIMPTTGATQNNPIGNDWALNCSRAATSRGTPRFAKEQCPPKDLSDNWNNQYGYSKTFYNFVYNLVSRYKGRIPKIQIMQEAVNNNFWEAGTSEEAVKIMKTGYKAAHDADPNIVVLNEGGAGGGYAFAVIKDKMESGASEQEVMTLAEKMLWRTVGNGLPLKSYKELRKVIYRPLSNNESAMDKIAYYIDHCAAGCFDVYNFGSKSDPETLPLITQWIRERMRKANYSRKIGVNYEMGLHANFPSETTYTEEDFANDVFKLLITNLGEGVELMLFYGFEDSYTKSGPAGTWGILKNGQWREATYAYRSVATKINETYKFDHLIESGSVKRYVFKNRDSGLCDLEAAWSNNGEQRIKIQTGKDTINSVNNYKDENVSYTKGNGWIELTISSSPVFIQWANGKNCTTK